MKVLLSQYVDGIGGSEIYLMKLAPALLAHGIEVQFALLTRAPDKEQVKYMQESLEKSGVPVRVFLMQRLPKRKQLQALYRFLKQEQFDLVHSNLLITDWVFAWIKLLFGYRFVLVSAKHGYEEKYNNKYRLETHYKFWDGPRLLYEGVERFVDRSFAVSPVIARLYQGLKIVRDKQMCIITHGFDYPETGSQPALRLAPRQLVVVGRLVELKGHRYAIGAVADLKARYPDLKLVIVGSGVLETTLRQQCREAGIEEEVVFAGFQKNTLEWMASSDIVLVPSLLEAFGLVLIEAMSVRKPIIAFDLPAMNEIIQHNVTGLLCAPASQPAYTAAIEELLQNPVRARAMGEAAYALQKEQYSLKKMAEETILFYQETLQIKAKKP